MPKSILLFAIVLFGCQSVNKDVADQHAYSSLNTVFQLGAPEEHFLPHILENYPGAEVLEYSGDMAAPFEKQTQVNAQGIMVFDKKRYVEFLFNDGVLGHVWIFFDKEEIDSIKTKLAADFGGINIVQEPYTVFNSKNIAIRTDPYEILLADEELLGAIIGIE